MPRKIRGRRSGLPRAMAIKFQASERPPTDCIQCIAITGLIRLATLFVPGKQRLAVDIGMEIHPGGCFRVRHRGKEVHPLTGSNAIRND